VTILQGGRKRRISSNMPEPRKKRSRTKEARAFALKCYIPKAVAEAARQYFGEVDKEVLEETSASDSDGRLTDTGTRTARRQLCHLAGGRAMHLARAGLKIAPLAPSIRTEAWEEISREQPLAARAGDRQRTAPGSMGSSQQRNTLWQRWKGSAENHLWAFQDEHRQWRSEC